MPDGDYLGAERPTMTLYLPHRPKDMSLDVADLLAANSNHWRKILTLLAKVACPVAEDWRRYRDQSLLTETALCFAPELAKRGGWHWIGGKGNRLRFEGLQHTAQPLPEAPAIEVDPHKRLLITPYPDYRQLSNTVVEQLRRCLWEHDFYADMPS